MHDVGSSGRSFTCEGFSLEEEELSIVDAIYKRLRVVFEYRPDELKGSFDLEGRDWKLALHAAEELLLNEGIVFQPVPSVPGLRRRAERAKQAQSRSARFSAAARRKMERAVKLVRAAVGMTEDPQEKARLERLELRRANALVDSLAAVRGAGEKRPKGL